MEPQFAPILASMRAGVSDGVSPPTSPRTLTLLAGCMRRACEGDPTLWSARWHGVVAYRGSAIGVAVKIWPEINGTPFPISDDAVRLASEGEARLFHNCFGAKPLVAVPTTFVWRPAVEAGWAAGGVRVIVTPGHYYRDRDEFTRPHSAQ